MSNQSRYVLLYTISYYILYFGHSINTVEENSASLLIHLLRKADLYLTRIFNLDLSLKWQ